MKKYILIPFIFLLVELVTLIQPTFWGEHQSIKYIVDIFYTLWIFEIGYKYNPRWFWLFITWSASSYFIGIELPKYQNASEAFLVLDAVISIGFIIYEVITIEIPLRMFKEVAGMRDGKIKSYLLERGLRILLKSLIQHWNGGAKGLLIYMVINMARSETTDIMFVESEGEKISFRFDENKKIICIANRRKESIIKLAMKKNGDELINFLQNHQELQ